MPGPDGVVRVVKIKTASGEYVRPVAKLCILITDSDDVFSDKENRAGDVTDQVAPGPQRL